MKNFQCTNCGCLLQRPTQPFNCPQCGRQAINLFRAVAGGAPQPGMWPPQPGQQMPMPQQGMPQQGAPMQPGMPMPHGMPGYGGPQPMMPQGQQPAMPAPPGAIRMPRSPMPQAPYRPGIPGQYPAQPPAQQYPAQQPPAAQYPAQQYPPQQYPAQPYPAQPPAQQYPQQPTWPQPGQPYPQQPTWPQGPAPVQPMPQQPSQYQPLPQQPLPQQGMPGQPAAPQHYAQQPPAMQPQPVAPPPGSYEQAAQPIILQTPSPQVPPSSVAPPPPVAQAQPQSAAPTPPPPPTQPAARQPSQQPAAPARPQQAAKPAPTAPAASRPSQSPPSQEKSAAPSQPKPVPKPAARPETGRPSSPAAQSPRASATPVSGSAPSEKTSRPTAKPQQAVPPPPKPVEKPRERPKSLRPEQFVWAFPEEPPFADEAMPMRYSPAVDADGRMYLHVGDRLVALDEEGGRAKLAWEYVTGCRAPGPVVVAPDGTIRVHTADGLLHAMNHFGKQIWTPVRVGEPLGYAMPVVDAEGNTFICAFAGGLLKVDAQGKTQKNAPFFRVRQKLDSGAVIRDNILYVGSDEGYVFAIAIDGAKGQNLWNHAADQGHTGWYVHSAPAVSADGVIIVAGSDEKLYGFRPNGEADWRADMPGQMLGSPVLDGNGHVYVGISQSLRGQSPQGSLVCLDGNSHKIRWEYRAHGPVESTPVIGDDGVLYFGDNEGGIHAIDNRGNAIWTAKVETAVRSSGTILAPERLAFGLDNQTLVVLKCSSQSIAAEGWPKLGCTVRQCGGL